MCNERINGWTNWATYNAVLWFDYDFNELVERVVSEALGEYAGESIHAEDLITDIEARYAIAAKELIEDNLDSQYMESGYFHDAAERAFSDIDFDDIASSFVDKYDIEAVAADYHVLISWQ